jgi:hypothetical protein
MVMHRTGAHPVLQQRRNNNMVLSDFVHAILDQQQTPTYDREYFESKHVHSSMQETISHIKDTRARLRKLVLENRRLVTHTNMPHV